ncbi:hypothetical protein GGX14DRAFT_651161 [Mycena pura]|uniref:Uncharacterized protein n=1 Tax=Mycena pura TaxID=153505 RepID=A0AAD7E375_9AGAR|nr:hypothetical protein GGX14DRAFT_651161 [Mycena pura]
MHSFSSLITVCFISASALCSLSVQAAPGHAGELSARQVAVANPFVMGPFAAGSTALVTSDSHALFTQKLVLTGPPAVCTLQGSGEGVDMTVPGSNPTSTECTFAPATTADPLPLSALFQFSSTGPGGTFINTPRVTSSTHQAGNLISIAAMSEDSTDNDNNDSEVSITIVLFPTRVAAAQSIDSTSAHALVESGMLFNPTNGITVSVGPFAGNSTLSDFKATTEDWNTVTGEIIDVQQDAPFSNVLLMRFLFSDSTDVELKDSTLLVNGVMRYTGARPTGTPTRVNWYSKVVTEQSD